MFFNGMNKQTDERKKKYERTKKKNEDMNSERYE